MINVLNIAEKNSVAKEIAKHLSKGSSSNSPTLSKFNPIYNFQIPEMKYRMKVSSVRGHVIQYTFHKQYRSWSKYNPRIFLNEVQCLIQTNEEMSDLVANLESLAKGVQLLILWLDCDRQGEAIAFQVIQIIQRIIPHVQIKRARFSAVTSTDVWNAFRNLVNPNQYQADAVNYRRQVDLRLGVSFTIFQTLTLQNSIGQSGTVSYGPCQFPTLGFVVQRYLKVKNFVPEKYWMIKAYYVNETSKEKIQFKWKRHRLFCELSTNILFLNIVESYPSNKSKAKISNQTKTNKKKFKPYPLSTIQLQKIGTRKLKMPSNKIMELAQKLYQKGCISYPRTQTTAYPPTMNMLNLVKLFENNGEYQTYTSKLLQEGKFQRPRNGNKNDQAHPPIHPVKACNRDSVSAQQWQVYDLISRHFLGSCSKDAEAQQRVVYISVGEEQFYANHLTITAYNFLQIYTYQKWTQSTIPQIPPQFFPLLEIDGSQTSPPGYLTQAQLIDLMDKNQIGTDSTIHQHIKNIQQREYAVKTNNTLKPTPLGLALVLTYNTMGMELSNCSVRRNIQINMNQIVAKRLTKDDAVKKTIQEMIPIYDRLFAQKYEWISLMKTHLPNSHGASVFNEKTYCHICNAELKLEGQTLKCIFCQYALEFPVGNYSKTDFKCPICNFVVLEVVKGKKKYPDSICLFCYNNSQEKYKSNPHVSHIQCDTCTYNCPKAKGALKKELFSCPKCRSKVNFKTSNNGRKFLGCSSYPSCRWSQGIMNYVKNVTLLGEKCQKCQEDTMAAVVLDQRFIDDISLIIKLAQKTSQQIMLCLNPLCTPSLFQEQRAPNNLSFDSRQPKKGQQCFKCKKPGHYANACPELNKETNNKNHKKHNSIQFEKSYKKPASKKKNDWKQNNGSNSTTNRFENNSYNSKFTCFNCHEVGHIAPNCPKKRGTQSSVDTVKNKSTGAGCKLCGHVGRHPKGSNCPKLKNK